MTIHIGLIGGGNISETHARAARAILGVNIAAVYGTNPAKVGKLCREHGGKSYHDLDTFLRHRPMDFVVVGSPSGLHAAHGIAAAKCGLHVLTEKPIDISVSRADDLIDATNRASVKLGVIFQDRGKPEIRRVKEWIDGGLIGKPLLADARVKWYRPPEYYGQSKWRGTLELDGGGALINQAVHTVDLLLWLLGDTTRVQAFTSTSLHTIEAEDTALALFQFAGGALGTLQATTAAFPGYPRRVEITGSEGTVILEQDRIVAADLKSPPPGIHAGSPTNDMENTASPAVSDFKGHQAIFEDFIRAIREDATPLCDGHEGRRSIALVEEIYRAARQNGKY
jgi:UDP-N-acetyl-2-amino-2-deoxyglucuronate dehydrogenase